MILFEHYQTFMIGWDLFNCYFPYGNGPSCLR